MEIVEHDAARLLGDHRADPHLGRQLEPGLQFGRIGQISRRRLPTLLGKQSDVRITRQDGDGPEHQARGLRVTAGCGVRAE